MPINGTFSFYFVYRFPLRQVSRYYAQVNHAAGPGEPQAPQPFPLPPRGCSSIYYFQASPKCSRHPGQEHRRRPEAVL